jgi:hypothetical protein
MLRPHLKLSRYSAPPVYLLRQFPNEVTFVALLATVPMTLFE